MIRFIFTMLFYGVLLGCIASLALWFFAGMTIQQSIDWLSDKIKNAPTVVATEVKGSAKQIEKQFK
ncbi:MAG: hypothetical protein J6P93_03935 [Alphaproteobacteria bacterium]|nr:hypothetical protein [Alphaproteobacteria bacterium]